MSAFRPDGWTTPELAQAVERGQLELHYQPVVDLRSGGIVGAEALLRWRHPTLGLLPPGQFLPVVESSGLMPEIGAWVLGEACRQMRDWRMLAWRPFRLAVNVSASQVGPDFDGWVKGVLADAELPAEYLEIELTESVAFGDPAIFPALDALRQIGVRFAADDFGTGYSCLQHLKCCPISTLKIDQSFVAGLANDRRDQTIVHTVIQLAHGLGMDVVAEGVETSASLDLLRQAALLQRLAAVRGRLSLCADQAAAAKWWLSMPMASVSAEGPMPKALSTRRTSPLMPGCRHQGRACPLRRARMTSNPLIVA